MLAISASNMENKFIISANGKEMTASFADNSSARAFRDLISNASLTVEMSDYGGFEKVGDLGHTLPANDTRITTEAGDVILYLGCNITIYYDVNTWSFTRLGKIDGNPTRESILSVLGNGSVNVTFSLKNSSSAISQVCSEPEDLKVTVSGRCVTIDDNNRHEDICIYDINGKPIYRGSQRRVSLPAAGIYLVECGNVKAKIMVK